MEIIHHLAWRPSDAQVAELLGLGFAVNAPDGLFALDVDEADPRWPAVRALTPTSALDMVFTRSTEQERGAASWLVMNANGHRGYPQPEDNFRTATYDLTAYCSTCGTGAVQRAPFRLRRDPMLKPQRLLQLNWVFDVFFTSPVTWHQVFQPFGVGAREVVLHSTGNSLRSLVQLEPTKARAPLALGQHASEVCIRCDRQKYLPFTRGFLPAFSGPAPGTHLAVSREVFGSGASAWQKTLVSAALYHALRTAKVRGVSFIPTLESASYDAPAG